MADTKSCFLCGDNKPSLSFSWDRKALEYILNNLKVCSEHQDTLKKSLQIREPGQEG